jgi:molybdopterin-guanine dinucleotide biosynthesis protein
MKTIGFAGTAKNTGKTTTALAVIKQAHAAGVHIALTSIGFDGENRDNVTGLPKPRYVLEAGDLVATAADCMTAGTAVLEAIEDTTIETILGNVVIAKVVSTGTALIAGANREKDLAYLIQRFAELHIDLLLVDGALNRIVPMIVCDGLVLSTGAAFDQDIHILTAQAGMLVHLFTPLVSSSVDLTLEKITLTFEDHSVLTLETGSLLSTRTMNDILAKITKPVAILEVPGACHPVLLKTLLDKNPFPEEPIHLIFGNPLKLVASGGLPLWQTITLIPQVTVSYRRTLPVNILTVNPYYPKLKPQTGLYQSAYVDKYFLLRSMRIILPDFPVYDLLQPPQPDLLRLLGVSTGE